MITAAELSNLPFALCLWFLGLTIHLIITTGILVSFTWSLLFLFRFCRIPWVDGTTKGFINRS